MKHLLSSIVLLACGSVVSAAGVDGLGGASQGMSGERPNVVVFLVDDLGWRDTGYTGSDFYKTPGIDALAAEGAVFTAAYANAANCAPSRAALLSGMFASRTGVYTVSPSARGNAKHRRLIPVENTNFLDGEEVTIAEVLKSAGYRTCHVGKWHVGEHDGPTSPTAQGFDVNIGGYSKGHPDSYFSPYYNPALADGPEGEYLTDRLTDGAVSFIEGQGDDPYFVYFSFYTVHTPIQPRADLLAEAASRPPGTVHGNAAYAGMVAALDEAVGRVLAAVDARGERDETVVIFTSDNGGHGGVTSMAPLRGSKGMFSEGGIRVPLAVRWPGKIEAGLVIDEPVQLFDLYPTLAEFAGADLPTTQPVDGASLAPALLETSDGWDRGPLFWHFPAYLQAYGFMEERWRAVPCSVIRDGRWKLIETFETETVELYDLEADPFEQRDVGAAYPLERDRLAARLRIWHHSTDSPIVFQTNPRFETP